MTVPDDVAGVARGAGGLSELTDPHDGECLFCYVYRMLDLGCLPDQLHWTRRWRALRAPRATGVERRLAARGGFYDCEIFMNGWRPRELVLDENGDEVYPAGVPPCPGVRPGSTQPCRLWIPKPRGGWAQC
jgi:Protein of unknown function (DUF2695)